MAADVPDPGQVLELIGGEDPGRARQHAAAAPDQDHGERDQAEPDQGEERGERRAAAREHARAALRGAARHAAQLDRDSARLSGGHPLDIGFCACDLEA